MIVGLHHAQLTVPKGAEAAARTFYGIDRRRTKAHLGFLVEDLGSMRSLIQRLGLEVSEGEPIPGLARFALRDPFGNRMEFLQHEPSS